MMRIFRIAAVASIALVALLAGPQAAKAQGAGSPEALAAARELSAIMSKDLIKQLVAQITAQVWPPLEKTLRGKHKSVTPVQIAELRSEFERIQSENLARLMDDAPAIYARHFTAAELQDMLAFQRSEVGRKSVALMPQIMGEALAMMNAKMPQVQNQIMESFTKVLQQKGFPI